MTELLSQAYSKGNGLFHTPPWMKVLVREYHDPFAVSSAPKNHKPLNGLINVIDLANIYSCAFIETQDLGRMEQGKLRLMGRFDHSDIRGCNLLVGN